MTPQTRDKVDRTRDYLLGSELPEDTKDGLGSLIDAAAGAANGTTDRATAMADAILALSLHTVRAAVRAPADRRAVLSEHVRTCPLSVAGRKGAIIAVLMRPGPWIALGMASFSPHFPAMLAVFERWAK